MQPDPNYKHPPKVAAAVLAGGKSRRFNYKNKALVTINGVTMLEHCIARLKVPPLEAIGICAHNNNDLKSLGYPLIEEANMVKGGPLRGLLSAMRWCANLHPDTLLLTIPCDTPRLPETLLTDLLSVYSLSSCDCVIAANQGRRHPTIGLWHPNLATRLQEHINTSDNLSLLHWIETCRSIVLDFGFSHPDPFININTEKDLHQLTTEEAP